MHYTNTTDIPLSVAVWLLSDDYDHNRDPKVISATSLIKPMRSIILSQKLPTKDTYDVSDFAASRTGSAVHDGIERAWNIHRQSSLKKLGYPEKIWSNVQINPRKPSEHPDWLDVYMELRGHRALSGYTISGKFDFVMEGQVEDFKNTSVFTWIFDSNADDYIKQGSIYKWLFPELITSNTIAINYIFSDWKKRDAMRGGNYPSAKIKQKHYPLMSLEETENWLKHRISEIEKYLPLSQAQLPICTKDELWQNDSVWKYYKDPKKTARSSKNFKIAVEAHAHLAKMGVGIVKEFKAEAKRCNYCAAYPVCLQAEELVHTGLLTPLT